MTKPILTVIAGANGAGKSTLTKWAREFFQQDPILDPDAIALDLRAQSSLDLSPIEAGRQVLEKAAELLDKRLSFSLETTLSGGTYLRMLRDAKKRGYSTCLVYIGTDDLSINLERVKARVLKGGHDVPLKDQIRRYPRSYRNLPRALELVDEGVLLDNSIELGHRVVAVKSVGGNLTLHEPLPAWAVFLHS